MWPGWPASRSPRPASPSTGSPGWPTAPAAASWPSRSNSATEPTRRPRRCAGAGPPPTAEHDDRLVILFSHHGVDTLTNTRGWHPGPGGEPLIGAAELVGLLHRFPNVVLWLNGHTHTNAARPRPDPVCPGRGFWEVTTCAVVDWPCQTRLVELAGRDGQLSITCTMVDHNTPRGPQAPGTMAQASAALFSPDDLAALHRELAANIPFGGGHPGRSGTATDRNVELLVSPPFPVDRLPGL